VDVEWNRGDGREGRTGIGAKPNSAGTDTAVYLYVLVREAATKLGDFGHASFKEFLTAATGIDCHHEEHICGFSDSVCDGCRWRIWGYGDACTHAPCVNRVDER
jgi:hypothetical protein